MHDIFALAFIHYSFWGRRETTNTSWPIDWFNQYVLNTLTQYVYYGFLLNVNVM